MNIEILGTGCKRCEQLYENALSAASQFREGTGIEVKKVKDIRYFAQKGVFVTPGLVIDDELISVGKVLSIEEIRKIIKEKL